MGRDCNVGSAFNQEIVRFFIKHHRVSTSNTLHERVAKTWRFFKQGRQTYRSTLIVYQTSARAVDRGNVRRHSFQAIERAGQLSRLPYIILIRKCVVCALQIRIACKGQEICHKSSSWAFSNNDFAGAMFFLEIQKNGASVIFRTVVRSKQSPISKVLLLNGAELI